MAKKTKRKIAHPKLPMQRQLNLAHEGKHFDLRAMFDRLNERYFRGRLRGYKVVWGRRRKRAAERTILFLERSRKKTASSAFNPLARSALRSTLVSPIRSLSRNAALGRSGRTAAERTAAGPHRENSIGASASSRATGARAAGKKKISPAFCVRLGEFGAHVSQRSRRGAGESLSDGESVVATFFLMRYQRVVASRREINFRAPVLQDQFSS